MEVMKKKFPSLPPNYVSLQQLQERRLKEEQQKQKEKEEEERLREEKEELRKKEEEERKLKESQKALEIKNKTLIDRSYKRNSRRLPEKHLRIEEERKLKEPQKALEIKTKASIDRSYKRNSRKSPDKHRRIKEEIDVDSPKQESAIVVTVAAEIPDSEQKLEELKKKKKKKKRPEKNKKSKELKVDEILNGDLKETPPSEIYREKVIPVVPPESSKGKKEMRNRFWSQRKKQTPESGDVLLNQTMEIAGRMECLSIVDDVKNIETNGEIGVNREISTSNVNGGGRSEFRGGSRRFSNMNGGGRSEFRGGSRRFSNMNGGDRSEFRGDSIRFGNRRQPRDSSNLVWVRKGENSEGIPSGFRLSSRRN